nr:MAG TPA: tail completion protein [Caudoviricetes sp.]
MVKLKDIKKALITLLNEVKPDLKIFSEDIEQIETIGESAFPLLFIQLVPLSKSVQLDGKSCNKLILVDITFMEKSKSSNEDMYEMVELVTSRIGIGFKVSDRFLKILNIGSSIADDTLHITFNLDFFDDMDIKEQKAEVCETISF